MICDAPVWSGVLDTVCPSEFSNGGGELPRKPRQRRYVADNERMVDCWDLQVSFERGQTQQGFLAWRSVSNPAAPDGVPVNLLPAPPRGGTRVNPAASAVGEPDFLVSRGKAVSRYRFGGIHSTTAKR